MITKQEVQHIAKLARLGLKPKEIEKMRKDLSAILDYMEQLKEIDVSGIEPTTHSMLLDNVTRKDEIKKESPERVKRLIEASPERKEGWVKVKSILS